MKKYYSLFLFWSLLTGLSTSCSDDNKKDRNQDHTSQKDQKEIGQRIIERFSRLHPH